MSLLSGLAQIRPYQPTDRDFILSSWLRSCSETMPKEFRATYFASQHDVCTALIERCPPHVACAVDDQDQIIGWACGEVCENRTLLHWCYVKAPFRRHGIAPVLVESVFGGPPKRPIMTCPVKWDAHGRRLKASGWVLEPTLALHMTRQG